MHLKLISCQVFLREMTAAVARSPQRVDVEFLSKGLHDIGCLGMRERLQAAVDASEGAGYEAVLMGYGLCNNGLVGLRARSIPLVVPRAHDCITILLGSKERYLEYFHSHPGVYFKSTGWIEQDKTPEELEHLSIPRQVGMDKSLEDFIARYGEENGRYLHAVLGEHARHYGQMTFIEMGLEPDDRFERQTREEARQRGWKYEKIQGDLALIQRLVDGVWNEEEVLVVPPGWEIEASHDPRVLTARELSS